MEELDSKPEKSTVNKRNLSDYLQFLSVPAGLLMLLVVVADVTGRALIKNGIIWAPALESLLLVVMAFSSVAVTYREGGLVSTDVLVSHLNRRIRLVVDVFGLLLGLGCCVIIIWLSAVSAFGAIGDGSRPPTMNMPLWPWRMILPLGTAVLATEIIAKLVRTIHQFSRKQEAQ